MRRFLPLILGEVRPRGSLTDSVPDDGDGVGEWRPRWKMVFIWQCPAMFLSYSVCFFLAGLTLFVCTPLIRGDKWDTGSDVRLSCIICLDRVFVAYWEVRSRWFTWPPELSRGASSCLRRFGSIITSISITSLDIFPSRRRTPRCYASMIVYAYDFESVEAWKERIGAFRLRWLSTLDEYSYRSTNLSSSTFLNSVYIIYNTCHERYQRPHTTSAKSRSINYNHFSPPLSFSLSITHTTSFPS